MPFETNSELYPFRHRYFESTHGRVHYIDEGSGPPVVMLHGNPTWSFLYRNLIIGLRNRYRCIAPDYLGFGLSDAPPGFGYRPARHAEVIWELVTELGLTRACFVLHDWGGSIGLAVASGLAAAPDITEETGVALSPGGKAGGDVTGARGGGAALKIRTDALVIMNSWAWPVGPFSRSWWFSAIMGSEPGRHLIEQHHVFTRVVMRLGMRRPEPLDTIVRSHYTELHGTAVEHRPQWFFAREIRRSRQWLALVENAAAELAKTPTQLIWGMKDPAIGRRYLRRWESMFDRVWTHEVAGASHFVPEELGAGLADLVAPFLDEVVPR